MGHFYFVRHGQTVWNVEGKICGRTDSELTEYGHQQAVETGRKFLEEGIRADEILYSPLVRAAETARHISEIMGIPAKAELRLIEQHFGKWEGTSPRNAADFQKEKNSLPATMETENRRSSWPRESIICWMTSRQSQTKRRTFWLRTTESPELYSRILPT